MSTDELAFEQAFVSRLYARLDELRARADDALRRVRLTPATGTHANRSERDSFASLHENRLEQLLAVEDRLCFGRLDLLGGDARYVGRIGLSDDSQTQLLVDWRAPAAETFYQATAADPRGVVRRRHLTTRGRSVTGVEDEVLDMDGIHAISGLSGEGALLAALNANRTGRMRDIVATIQAEQDRVIRAPLDGVLVVQGGPGTGKTAVALHRAAYLLYTHRERIADRGVLIVGPNRAFLRYIEQVLPSLGETGVVMASAGELYPGVTALRDDEPAVARIKGDRRMADVIAAAVRARQRPPAADVRLDVDGSTVTLRRSAVEGAIGRAQ
ncbi:MAG: family ATPase, partial [Frankiales bacterium]|nr:family ATPase [Frankiales bacterium]